MRKTNKCCVIKLHALVTNIHKGSTHVVVDDALCKMLESLNNAYLIRGNDYITLPKHLEASHHRFKVLKEAGFDWLAPDFVMHAWVILSNM